MNFPSEGSIWVATMEVYFNNGSIPKYIKVRVKYIQTITLAAHQTLVAFDSYDAKTHFLLKYEHFIRQFKPMFQILSQILSNKIISLINEKSKFTYSYRADKPNCG